jgi:hypothetical protein
MPSLVSKSVRDRIPDRLHLTTLLPAISKASSNLLMDTESNGANRPPVRLAMTSALFEGFRMRPHDGACRGRPQTFKGENRNVD